jgi:hypothetical protein
VCPKVYFFGKDDIETEIENPETYFLYNGKLEWENQNLGRN